MVYILVSTTAEKSHYHYLLMKMGGTVLYVCMSAIFPFNFPNDKWAGRNLTKRPYFDKEIDEDDARKGGWEREVQFDMYILRWKSIIIIHIFNM